MGVGRPLKMVNPSPLSTQTFGNKSPNLIFDLTTAPTSSQSKKMHAKFRVTPSCGCGATPLVNWDRHPSCPFGAREKLRKLFVFGDFVLILRQRNVARAKFQRVCGPGFAICVFAQVFAGITRQPTVAQQNSHTISRQACSS